ncbi:2OG-Fe(II) oxygenase [Thermoactinospora rubra]|uniref:2OG-Fe(II) oxygenase n=1 Tax=Thermoactinospora rubra TaxID=1088767 RepID=UPI000A116A99|nr:2OG-Fe(II) oxygenase [Thermoactinospora rubra]
MTGTARERLAELLGALAEPAAPSAYRKLGKTDLSVTVDGIGPLRFPVSVEQAGQLRELGRQARFGRGEQTLTDPRVRDTWEIPTDLVHIRWSERFAIVLDRLREELGLPPGHALTPELHSMLLYETGQFFVTHQDSEKDDAMVATLVVTLPSDHTGGELVVEHRGETMEYRGSNVAVSLVAFYADCRHQVLPVKTGHRITLTYNLLLTGESDTTVEESLAAELATCLREHFTTPITPRYGYRPAAPPLRLAYLLDHEYTARGLSWSRLKGADADRAALLRMAAGLADCDVTLALAEIQETWDAYEEDEDWDYRYDEEEDEEAGEADGEYVVQDLIESAITLSHWISPDGDRFEEISLSIADEEVAATTATRDLTPYESQYEGYMGNYGNTLDRWYRRAAVVITPRRLGFATRAEASPLWALDRLAEMIAAGQLDEARQASRSLEPFWRTVVLSGPQSELLGKALIVAGGLEEVETAELLLRPFPLERLTPGHARALAELAARYGDAWTTGLLRGWSASWPQSGYAPDLLEWLPGLPALCASLLQAGAAGIAHRVVELSWTWLASQIRPSLTQPSTGRLEQWLTGMGRPLAGVLTAAARIGTTSVLDEAVSLGRSGGDQTVVLVMAVLRSTGPLPALNRLAIGCAARLRAILDRPRRADDDWSIELPGGCSCELCTLLGAFLRDPGRRTLDWPLAQDRRRHIHSRIDMAELPVSHQTRRQGRPYTLVLTKTRELFERERRARDRHEADLAWLTSSWEGL